MRHWKQILLALTLVYFITLSTCTEASTSKLLRKDDSKPERILKGRRSGLFPKKFTSGQPSTAKPQAIPSEQIMPPSPKEDIIPKRVVSEASPVVQLENASKINLQVPTSSQSFIFVAEAFDIVDDSDDWQIYDGEEKHPILSAHQDVDPSEDLNTRLLESSEDPLLEEIESSVLHPMQETTSAKEDEIKPQSNQFNERLDDRHEEGIGAIKEDYEAEPQVPIVSEGIKDTSHLQTESMPPLQSEDDILIVNELLVETPTTSVPPVVTKIEAHLEDITQVNEAGDPNSYQNNSYKATPLEEADHSTPPEVAMDIISPDVAIGATSPDVTGTKPTETVHSDESASNQISASMIYEPKDTNEGTTESKAGESDVPDVSPPNLEPMEQSSYTASSSEPTVTEEPSTPVQHEELMPSEQANLLLEIAEGFESLGTETEESFIDLDFTSITPIIIYTTFCVLFVSALMFGKRLLDSNPRSEPPVEIPVETVTALESKRKSLGEFRRRLQIHEHANLQNHRDSLRQKLEKQIEEREKTAPLRQAVQTLRIKLGDNHKVKMSRRRNLLKNLGKLRVLIEENTELKDKVERARYEHLMIIRNYVKLEDLLNFIRDVEFNNIFRTLEEDTFEAKVKIDFLKDQIDTFKRISQRFVNDYNTYVEEIDVEKSKGLSIDLEYKELKKQHEELDFDYNIAKLSKEFEDKCVETDNNFLSYYRDYLFIIGHYTDIREFLSSSQVQVEST